MKTINKEYKFFKALCKLGEIKFADNEILIVESLKNKGMQLKLKNKEIVCLVDPISYLSKSLIWQGLDKEISNKIDQLEVIFETESTNTLISNFPKNTSYSVVVSEYQSKGQGRRKKEWISPLGSNLYFSIKFTLHNTINSTFIPLITARAICQSFNDLGINDCKIKWPNDIYLNGMKTAGILAQSNFCGKNSQTIIIGVGVNVNMCFHNDIDQKWTSLRVSQKKNYDRNHVLSSILNNIISSLENISSFNFELFNNEWEKLDFLRGKSVKIFDDHMNYTATAVGLSEDGALIIQHNKIHKKLYSGDVSVKSID